MLCGDGKGVGESVSSLRVRESIEGTALEDDIEASKLHEKFLRSRPGSAFVGHPTHRVWGGGGGTTERDRGRAAVTGFLETVSWRETAVM